jgi:Na+/proline symporter
VLTSDVYRTLKRHEPTQKQLLRVVRYTSVLSGILMLAVAWMFQFVGNAVKLNNIIVSILDMPLFVVTVVYGLWWRRVNWQGALAGFLLGGVGSGVCYYLYWNNIDYARQIAPIVSTLTALIVTPIVTLLTPADRTDRAAAMLNSIGRGDASEGDAEPFHLVPDSAIGKGGAIAVIVGFLMFLVGVLSAPVSTALAGALAVAGLIAVLIGGLTRVYAL